MNRRWPRYALVAGFALLCAFAVTQLLRGAFPPLSWFGLALAAGAPLAGLLTHTGERRPPLVWTALSGLGLAITMALSHRFGPVAGHAHAWAGAALIAWFCWVRFAHERPDLTRGAGPRKTTDHNHEENQP